MSTETRTQYRIMARRPGAKRYTHSGTTGTLEMARRRIETSRTTRAGKTWDYRVDTREVVITSTPWKVAETITGEGTP